MPKRSTTTQLRTATKHPMLTRSRRNTSQLHQTLPKPTAHHLKGSSPTSKELTVKLWDRLPPEIHCRILDYSNPLTQYLHHHGLYAPESINLIRNRHKREKLETEVWICALEMDWDDGDLNQLPPCFTPARYSDWYSLVKTKSMYERLRRLEWFSKVDYRLSRADGVYTYYYKAVLDIPMRNCWLEYLDNPFKKAEKKVQEAASGGHLKYFLHLLPDVCFEACWDVLAISVVEAGLLEDVKYVIQRRAGLLSSSITDAAASTGNRELFDMLCQLQPCTWRAITCAAQAGDLELLQHLSTLRTPYPRCAMQNAIINGHLSIVRYLHEQCHDDVCSTISMNFAAREGHLEILKYLHENCEVGCTTIPMDLAAANGHIDTVIFLHENCSEGCTTRAMDMAAKNGHLDVVEWLHENREEGCTYKAMDGAAAEGHLDVVKWLALNRSEGGDEALENALINGHTEVAEYLKEHPELLK
ncbi:hypothetical protein HDV05_006005 [Chytridiales sp. JEL 0842]|nr:hypothetical protein HDV05_006005 [Chytridiales sp. JEL 0842]